MSLAECQNNPIDVNFYLQKSLEIFDKKFSWQILIQKGQGVESALPHANKGFQLRGIYSNLSGEVNLLKPLIKNPFNYGKVWKENLPLAQSLNTYKHSCLPIISRFSFIFQVQFLSNHWEGRGFFNQKFTYEAAISSFKVRWTQIRWSLNHWLVFSTLIYHWLNNFKSGSFRKVLVPLWMATDCSGGPWSRAWLQDGAPWQPSIRLTAMYKAWFVKIYY